MPRTSETLAEPLPSERDPMMPFLPFVEVATRGHCAETYEGEDHARWLMSLERRGTDPRLEDPHRPSIPPELGVMDDEPGPDLE